MSKNSKVYGHYFKPCPYDEIDLYRFAKLFNINDNSLFHAFKKIVVAGNRGSKSPEQDIEEAIDALNRYLEMREEDLKIELGDIIKESIEMLEDINK